MEQYIHPNGFVERVPERSELERAVLDAHGLSAIVAILANQAAILQALSDLGAPNLASLDTSKHPIIDAASRLEADWAAMQARLKEVNRAPDR
jgi:hypothetical protein